jgi:ribose transport system substrate-binding protein
VGIKSAEAELKLAERGLQAVMVVSDGTDRGQIDKLRQYATQSDIVAVGISVMTASNVAIADELRALQKKGIHVLACDGDVDRAKLADARFGFIGTDNFSAGRELGIAIRHLRPDGGKMVTFVGRTGAQNAIDRKNGVVAGAGEKFSLVDNMADEMVRKEAQQNVRNAIINHPEVNTLVGIWSYNGPAIADVLRELGRRKDFTAVTFDAEPTTIELIERGELDCMIVQNPYEIGYQSIRLLTALVENDTKIVQEMFPNHGQPGGDLFETGLKMVVPNTGSPLNRDMFGPKTEFLKLEEFKAWLTKYDLKGS